MIVVSDSGPLIALARAGWLHLLLGQFEQTLIPQAVARELHLGGLKPGVRELEAAVNAGAICIRALPPEAYEPALLASLDPGETEALLLARHIGGALLLADEKKARNVARRMGIEVAGTAGLLVRAKRLGLVSELRPVLADLHNASFRMSQALIERVLSLSGEA